MTHNTAKLNKNIQQSFQYPIELIIRIGNSVRDSPRSIGRETKLTLVLVKLKLNVPFVTLAGMFGVGQSRVEGLFLEGFEPLAKVAKDLIVWYNRDAFISQRSAHFRFTLKDRLTSSTTIIYDILLCHFAVT